MDATEPPFDPAVISLFEPLAAFNEAISAFFSEENFCFNIILSKEKLFAGRWLTARRGQDAKLVSEPTRFFDVKGWQR